MQHQYLNQISLLPSSAISNTFETLPTSLVPNIITRTTARIMALNWSVSVHTTALNKKQNSKQTEKNRLIELLPEAPKGCIKYANKNKDWCDVV
jgi:hypothetical protein